MKKYLHLAALAVFASLSFAASVLASPPAPYQNDPPPQCPYASVDQCMQWYGDGTGWPGTDPSSCSGGQCLVCALDNTGYREYCLYITMSASCTCTIYKPEGSGPNITACQETGQCTYRH